MGMNALTSRSLVAVESPAPHVAVVRMQDRQNKNTFTPEFCQELQSAFAQIEQNSEVRCVVLTGYDTYFASGGSKEALLAIQDGAAKFTDMPLYQLPLECPVPVIAAMQGHGIGGGFVLGMFADIVVLAREGVYTTNFMRYGFTPGMGATLVVPTKLGALGQEMLLTARNYRGEHLRERGVAFSVLPAAHVFDHSVEMAMELAQMPRESLLLLKGHLSAGLRSQLPACVASELAMHSGTFHKFEVIQRVASLFGN